MLGPWKSYVFVLSPFMLFTLFRVERTLSGLTAASNIAETKTATEAKEYTSAKANQLQLRFFAL